MSDNNDLNLSLRFNEISKKRLEALQQITKAATPTDVISDALTVYEFLVQLIEEGATIIASNDNKHQLIELPYKSRK